MNLIIQLLRDVNHFLRYNNINAIQLLENFSTQINRFEFIESS
jgi:hypothetical protein